MHLENVTTGWHNNQLLEKHLRSKMGSYQKTRYDFEILRPYVSLASSRAMNLDSANGTLEPNNPGSRIYQLIEAIETECGQKF